VKRIVFALAVLCLILSCFAAPAATGDGEGNERAEALKALEDFERENLENFSKEGQVVLFGRYEQDGDASNGPERIEWIVVSSNPQQNSTCLLSLRLLEKRAFQKSGRLKSWSGSDLRKWLNGDFVKSAFDEGEAAAILDIPRSDLDVSTQKKAIVKDRVYLESDIPQAEWFGEYAAARYIPCVGDGEEDAWFINDITPEGEAYAYDGRTRTAVPGSEEKGVRPWIWVVLSLLKLPEITVPEEPSEAVEAVEATLSKGDKGDAVRALQQKLVELGYLSGAVDGDFGNMTRDAVIAFQKQAGLEATGVVDGATQAALDAR